MSKNEELARLLGNRHKPLKGISDSRPGSSNTLKPTESLDAGNNSVGNFPVVAATPTSPPHKPSSGQASPRRFSSSLGDSLGQVRLETNPSPLPLGINCAASPTDSMTPTVASPTLPTQHDPITGKPKKKKDKKKRIINISLCKYPVIAQLADEFGFTIDADEEVEHFGFTFIWADTVLPLQKLSKLHNWQRFNHFPSMHLLSRKVHLGITLGRMRKVFSAHYAFYPRTWSLRSERTQFLKHLSTQPTKRKKGSTRGIFIMKPNCGSQGTGIIITKNPLEEVADPENYIVQEYIAKPLLIEGKKFDLRVYVLVTSIRHFSAFIFNDGLVRMCAEGYTKPTDDNMSNTCMHLTNYAVNKHSDAFVFNEDATRGDVGNKRDFKFFNSWLVSEGHDPVQLWDRVEYMICKSFMAAQPPISHVYNSCFGSHLNDGFTCFEVLGFDVMLDENLRPWLLEVNHTPSFNCDTPLDKRIKYSMLKEVWEILDVAGIDKTKCVEKDKLQALKRMAGNTAGGVTSPALEGTSTPQGDPDTQVDQKQREVQEMVTEVREREDKALCNFKRIFPTSNEARMSVYAELNAAAKELTSVQTTACQELRQNEIKAERERRGQEKTMKSALNMGTKPPQPPSLPNGVNPSAAVPSSLGGTMNPNSRHDEMSGSTRKTTVANLGSARAGGGNRRTSVDFVSPVHTDTSLRVNKDGSPIPQRPERPSPRGSSAGTAPAGSSSNLKPPSGTKTAPVDPKVEVPTTMTPLAMDPEVLAKRRQQQEKLNHQMERHRRRMVLGPRLSVFQLRESQVDAMTDAEGYVDDGAEPHERMTQHLSSMSEAQMLADYYAQLSVNNVSTGGMIEQQNSRHPYQFDRKGRLERVGDDDRRGADSPLRGSAQRRVSGSGSNALRSSRPQRRGGSERRRNIPLIHPSAQSDSYDSPTYYAIEDEEEEE